MTYATQTDMITRYDERQLIELTDRAEIATGVVNAAIVADALADASALIDSYVGKRYRLPVAPVPIILRNVCCAIAYLDLHRGRYAEETRVAYSDALDTLAKISNGSMVLDVEGTESKSAAAQVAVSQTDRQFSRKRGDW